MVCCGVLIRGLIKNRAKAHSPTESEKLAGEPVKVPTGRNRWLLDGGRGKHRNRGTVTP